MREKRLPQVHRNSYRPETGFDGIGRVVHEGRRGFPANEHQERTENPTGEHEVESNSLGTETEFDSAISGLMSRMDEMKLEPTVESAESTLQDPTDIEIDAALKAPELSEPHDYPAKDLELLMTEIDAILLEPETKVHQERKWTMPNDRYSTRIDFDLIGQLARRLDEIVQRGIVGCKPEAIRQALIEYFNRLDEQQLRRARLRFLEEKGTMPQR